MGERFCCFCGSIFTKSANSLKVENGRMIFSYYEVIHIQSAVKQFCIIAVYVIHQHQWNVDFKFLHILYYFVDEKLNFITSLKYLVAQSNLKQNTTL